MAALLKIHGVITIFLCFLAIHCNGIPVIGGEFAELGDFNYQVLLIINKTGVCGGSIIGENLVLSAGHCFDDAQAYQVVVYSGLVSMTNEGSNEHAVRRIYVHDFYKQAEGYRPEWDVAIVKIWGSFTNRKNVAIIPLPTKNFKAGELCKFSGWGRTSKAPDSEASEDLKWSYGIILSDTICKSRDVPTYYYEFCFIHQQNEATMFLGDSGGPFVCNGVLTGIMVSTTGDLMKPAIAVNVYELLDFINGVHDSPAKWCTIL